MKSDPEEVVWALETADSLWQRQERVDAIVWLRRASQAASEAQDDDRALALARSASELSDWLARNVSPDEGTPVEGNAVDALLTQRPEPLVSNEEVPLSAIPGDDLEEIEEVEEIEAVEIPESEMEPVQLTRARTQQLTDPAPPPIQKRPPGLPPRAESLSFSGETNPRKFIPMPARAKLP